MRRLFVLLMGFLPLLLGTAMDWAMMTLDVFPPLALVGILFLLFWGALAYWNSSLKETVGLLCVPALIDLLLVWYQELVRQAYWPNLAGRLSQYFFLPLLSWGYKLTFWSSSVFAAQAGCFFLLVCAASAGYLMGRKHIK